MDNNKILGEKLIGEINGLKPNFSAKRFKALKIDRLRNIADKLVQYSDNCMECSNFLNTFEQDLLDNLRAVDIQNLKVYFKNFKQIETHLCKNHKLVTKGYYANTYMPIGMSIGMSLGMVIGLSFSNNGMATGMSLGMCLGMSFGLLIGSQKDKDAEKKGIAV